MREIVKTMMVMCLTLLFIGFVYPEYIFTDDVIVAVDEDGNKIDDFWKLGGTVEEQLEWLTLGLQNGDDNVEVTWRWMTFLNAKEQDEQIINERVRID